MSIATATNATTTTTYFVREFSSNGDVYMDHVETTSTTIRRDAERDARIAQLDSDEMWLGHSFGVVETLTVFVD